MVTVLTYIGYALLLLFGLVLFLLFMAGLKLVFWFNFRSCKHCHHTMVYTGLMEDSHNGHYLFHCEHCGAWEEVPREEFFRDCGKDCNPNVL